MQTVGLKYLWARKATSYFALLPATITFFRATNSPIPFFLLASLLKNYYFFFPFSREGNFFNLTFPSRPKYRSKLRDLLGHNHINIRPQQHSNECRVYIYLFNYEMIHAICRYGHLFLAICNGKIFNWLTMWDMNGRVKTTKSPYVLASHKSKRAHNVEKVEQTAHFLDRHNP